MQNSTTKISLKTAGLVVIKDRKLLLAFSKNKKAWYLPGGKIAPGESARDGLIREVMEELQIGVHPDEIQFYAHISAPAFGEQNDLIMEQECFLYELVQIPRPCAEIESIEYFDRASYLLELFQVPGVIRIMALLKDDDLMD